MVDVSSITQEALDALEAKAADLEKFKSESAPQLEAYEKAKGEWEKEKTELESQANPNWQKARATIDALKAIAKDKGIEVDDDGNIKSNPQGLDINQIRQEAASAARGELLGGRLSELLSEYEPESAKLVKHYYDKLSSGETVSLQNIGSFVKQAENAARGNPENKVIRAAQFSGGAGPRQQDGGKTDEKVITDLGAKMGLGFAKQK